MVKSACRTNGEPPDGEGRADGGQGSPPARTTRPAVSVVIPAYNERRRLPAYLEAIREHFDHELAGCYEVIVVDDGSRDGLAEELEKRMITFSQLRVVTHGENRGKGAAVRTGMLEAAGRFVLFADADGATPIEEEGRLRSQLHGEADIAIGSRRVAGAGVRRKRHPLRRLIGRCFSATARGVLGLGVRDTQCGFKMFRREAAADLFAQLRENGYYFDLELLILANRCGYRVKEVPVNWSDQPGSRMRFTRELGRMLGAFWRLRRLKGGRKHP
ncbi:MAG: dolichyl-phosphate beta-glucosyltransferase [Thermoguttaceae bacterium]